MKGKAYLSKNRKLTEYVCQDDDGEEGEENENKHHH